MGLDITNGLSEIDSPRFNQCFSLVETWESPVYDKYREKVVLTH